MNTVKDHSQTGVGSIIGRPVGSVSWVCLADGTDRLAPVGAVGELLVEGPILARGYANDDRQTSEVFIQDPSWLLQGGAGYPGRQGRLYKTGDLVRYDEAGNLIYVGRKTDRRQLRDIGSRIFSQQLAETSGGDIDNAPTTDLERALQHIWGHVLHIDPAAIGINDNFFALGGDSIAAMKVVSQSRLGKQPLITVADIFRYKTIAALTKHMSTMDDEDVLHDDIAPFSLLDMDETECRNSIAADYGIDSDRIQDAYPCTPLQEGLLSLTSKSLGATYILRSVLELDHDVSIERFRDTWDRLVDMIPILRTRIVQSQQHGLLQVVVKDSIQWNVVEDLDQYLELDRTKLVELGYPLARFALVCPPESFSRRYFVLTMHHALYDAQSLSSICSLASKIYHQDATIDSIIDFKVFVKYLKQMKKEAAEMFWRSKFAKYASEPFPLLRQQREPQPKAIETRQLPMATVKVPDVTAATLVRAAWAMTVAVSSNAEDDVVFGAIQSGRSARIAGVEDIAGPTIAAVPVRVNVDPKLQTVFEFLQRVQKDSTDAIPYEQFGLHRIRNLSSEAGLACQFQTLLVVQPPRDIEIGTSKSLGRWSHVEGSEGFATYAVNIICSLVDGAVNVEAIFDETIISRPSMSRLLEKLGSFLDKLNIVKDSRLADLDILSEADRRDIWSWNRDVPPAVESSLHKLVEDKVESQPAAQAVCSWDGDFTYMELDQLATRLAYHLVELGVGPEVMVPLCFEKSKWTIVSMLAILKAGGAFIPTDPSQAADRRDRVFAQANARVVLASDTYADTIATQGLHVVTVNQQLMNSLSTAMQKERPLFDAEPTSSAYTIFTSGSTGQPKGVVVEHRMISSSCIYHGKQMGFKETSRVLQFCAYTFDPNILEIFTTLVYGGCICVPSESERLRDIEESMNRMRVDIAIFTPSTARLLDPQRLVSLRTLIMGGENALNEDFAKWSDLDTVINVYGPAECSIVHSMNVVDFSRNQDACIGKAIGSASWITTPGNPHRLAPIGMIGELLVEGPIVFRGYLHDEERTASAIVENPAWLVQGGDGCPGRQGRLYNTGDLVKYDEDGSLIYIGRKDTTTKIRGQRVDLGEVEYWLRECLPGAPLVAAEVIISRGEDAKPVLAAFVVQEKINSNGANGLHDKDSEPPAAQVINVPPEVEDALAEKLPSYMIPAVYFAVAQIPLNTSGKTDRRELRTIGASFTNQELAEQRKGDSSARSKGKPVTETERALQAIWARVLNIDPATISIDDSFFQLGGDSIAAMQVSSMARISLGNISTADIMRLKTLSRLAASVVTKPKRVEIVNSEAVSEAEGKAFGLSPIQELYVQLEQDPGNCFDQNFFLKLSEKTSFAYMTMSLETIISRHPMLRARFVQDENAIWQQQISDDVSGSLDICRLKGHTFDSDDVARAIRSCRERLDIRNGPLMAAVFIEDAKSQSVFISVHHLVIDLVSWRIILEELEELLSSGRLSALPPPTTEFQTWCALQSQYAAENLVSEAPSVSEVPETLASYWGLNDDTAMIGAATTSINFTLDESTTTALLHGCNDAFGTKPVELMISALAYSFSVIFPDRQGPAIFGEGHGRETWDDAIDISRTVGWFSTVFPACVGVAPGTDVLDIVRQTKDSMRSLPANGWSYFTSRFANPELARANASAFPMEVLFNYAGMYQQLERDDASFEVSQLPDGCTPASATKLRRFALFDVLAQVERGCMTGSVIYYANSQHQQRIVAWVDMYQTVLRQLAESLPARASEWTLSDFPMTFQSYDEIQEIRNRVLPRVGITDLEQIQDIHGCSSVQEGILIAQAKDTNNYRSVLDFELVATQEGPQVDIARVKKAWRAVVRRHSLLRAIFVTGSSTTLHVILQDPEPSFSIVQNQDDILESSSGPPYDDNGLQHHLFIHQVDTARVSLSLAINHSIVDAYSIGILLRDFKDAYVGNLDPSGPLYRDFITYLSEQSPEADRAFWTAYLDGVEPCLFPSLNDEPGDDSIHSSSSSSFIVDVPDLHADKIHAFSAKWEVTTAAIIRTAWALVLREYTGSEVPCFGNMTSCRDAPIDGVQDMFGPLIGMIPSRVRLDSERSIVDVLRNAHEDYMDSLSHMTYSLAAISSDRGVGTTGLFNSILSLQKGAQQITESDNGYDVRFQGGVDPVEVSDAFAKCKLVNVRG
ncbi:non-ribosomal peptide synthetase protein [Colletotrichum truncatum]|uniref:Non-ribosomal peptide synthetase protein n=1 Tax=Colletotrichum truncatum TaxID=5467 RepID=A0ACC3YD76_COLTU